MIERHIHDSIVITELRVLFALGTEITGHEILTTKCKHTGLWNYQEVFLNWFSLSLSLSLSLSHLLGPISNWFSDCVFYYRSFIKDKNYEKYAKVSVRPSYFIECEQSNILTGQVSDEFQTLFARTHYYL